MRRPLVTVSLAAAVALAPLAFVDAAATQTASTSTRATATSTDDPLLLLHRDFWAFRVVEQPLNRDDIPRIERPAGWVPRWATADLDGYRARLREFEARWKALDPSSRVPRQVDRQLVGAMIARVRWELEVAQGYRRNPQFYVDQTLGSLVEALLPPPPFGARRSADVLARLSAFPRVLEEAKINLDDARAPFARLAVEELRDIGPRLRSAMADLGPRLPAQAQRAVGPATEKAVSALDGYRQWLEARLPTMGSESAVGRDAYVFFLREVALVPFSPEELLAMGRQEWERAASFEVYEKGRNRGLPEMPIFKDAATQIAAQAEDERSVRRFLSDRALLTLPDSLPHYVYLPLPGYLRHLSSFGEGSEFTSPTRLTENATRYVPEPRPDLGYFSLSMARDPRPIIVHEGVPGHYAQLWLSWQHENEIRRRYVDSGPSEGIGFYAEELLLQAGLFDDRPRTREVIYNFMRLRALRVEVDVKLATAQFSIEEAGEYLSRTVPMDLKTARDEAALFASTPGQAITYQVGKLQVLRFLAEARRARGAAFDLRAFHDALWRNGNVPIALQEREYQAAAGGAPAAEASGKRRVHLKSGITMSYLEAGPRHGAPLILLHGLGDTSRSWVQALPALAQRHRVFVLDQRGHGDTQAPACCYSLADMAHDVVAFMDAMQVAEAAIAGHSMGSFVGQHLAAAYPGRVRKLVLLASSDTSVGTEIVDWLWQKVATAERGVDSDFVDEWQSNPTPVNPDFLAKVKSETAAVPLHVWRGVARTLRTEDQRRFLGEITAPTLILWGEQDPAFPKAHQELLQGALAHAVFKAYPRVGHNLHWEIPEQVAEDVIAFLD